MDDKEQLEHSYGELCGAMSQRIRACPGGVPKGDDLASILECAKVLHSLATVILATHDLPQDRAQAVTRTKAQAEFMLARYSYEG